MCVQTCATTSDCANPATSCQGGSCLLNPCTADAGPYFFACDAATDGGDGFCQPYFDNAGNLFGACTQTGTAALGGPCDLYPARSSPEGLCGQGDVCFPVDGGGVGYIGGGAGGFCEPACTPGGAPSCAEGSECAPNLYFALSIVPETSAGVCLQSGASGCTLDFGAAFGGLGSYELGQCVDNNGCGCPDVCQNDPGSGFSRCELPCTTDADCDVNYTTCVDGFCALNFCGATLTGDAAPGTLGGECPTADAGSGTCFPLPNAPSSFGAPGTPDGLPALGYCIPDGTATAGSDCSASITNFDPTLNCAAGSICLASASGSPTCFTECDAVGDGGAACPADNLCADIWAANGYPDVVPTFGACLSCLPTGSTCSASGVCCNGACGAGGTCP